MKRTIGFTVLALSVAAAGGLPAAAADGGSPVPGVSYGAGASGPPGLPTANVRYTALPDGKDTLLIVTRPGDGEVRKFRRLDGDWGLPATTLLGGEPGGLSANGDTLVLIRPDYSFRPDETNYLVLGARRLRVRDRLEFDGAISYDAISPDGETVFFVDYERITNQTSLTDPLEYDVRAYDLSREEFLPGAIVDPEEPGEQMAGQPISRETSPDGRWAYTLYTGGEETFIHALDTVGRTAVCVDLTEFPPKDPLRSTLGLDVDAASGAITVLDRNSAAATVDPETFEVAPVPEAGAPAAADASSFPWALVPIAALAAAGMAVFAIRRRRRRGDEAELGRVFQAARTEEERREPELVP